MNSPLTVSELSRDLKNTIERNFDYVFVLGEISNFKRHFSGHIYFLLKDSKAQINAVIWKARADLLNIFPADGMKVLIKGRITLYETRGSYQIDVFNIQPSGEGELQIAFENLKRKLEFEGLFDSKYKKSLPEFPERVAVITSETGAAIQDFLKVTERRYPVVTIYLINAGMQGSGSANSVCKAIAVANKIKNKPEIIVITRGGGSIEDLWTFNEEKVARAVFASEIPVVSAIGHEVDFTICDFTADVRASTPSAAAELIFPVLLNIQLSLNDIENNFKRKVLTEIKDLKSSLNKIENNYYFKKPADMINEYKMNLDNIEQKLADNAKKKLNEIKIRLERISKELIFIPGRSILNLKNLLNSNEKLLNSLNPENVLKRGFAIIKMGDKIISYKKQLNVNDNIQINFNDGEADAVIDKLK
ncbi:MAG TPA: exodeoxyribonuclease VII large subunit [Ignavibacteria bacterium]|nr:exodeoxyribonuclease VII large subunit [Ignavibacteria bacterium]